jgi:endonuclease III
VEEAMESEGVKAFLENLGRRYSEILGIDLSSAKEEEVFKWFMASILFGAPITEKAAIKTYKCFEEHKVQTPQRIIETGWNGLVEILDEGGYTRYDFKTADKLLEVMQNLIQRYNGSLTSLYNSASEEQDLEQRIRDLGKGIGDITVCIFLRELRDVWGKASPKPTSLVALSAEKLGIVRKEVGGNVLQQLEAFWSANRVEGKSFINLETALLRLGKDFCRKKRCAACPVRAECSSPEAP